MKTNFKYIKTVAAIFLALVFYSCHDELIEQQDVSNTNQEFSKKSKKYWGSFIKGGYSGTGKNLLISQFPGNSSSLNFTIQWPYCTTPNCETVVGCNPIFELEVVGVESGNTYCPNYRVQISLFKKAGKITGFQMWLHDGTYRFATDKIKLDPFGFPAAETNVVIPINKTVVLYRNIKGSGSKKRESVREITIGSLKYWIK